MENKYDVFATMAEGAGIKYFFTIASTQSGFYALTSVPVRALGDGEGFFTLDEIGQIEKEFSKADNPSIERHPKEIREFLFPILSKALSEERFNEYKKLYDGN